MVEKFVKKKKNEIKLLISAKVLAWREYGEGVGVRFTCIQPHLISCLYYEAGLNAFRYSKLLTLLHCLPGEYASVVHPTETITNLFLHQSQQQALTST